jgi:hypothetical protein
MSTLPWWQSGALVAERSPGGRAEPRWQSGAPVVEPVETTGFMSSIFHNGAFDRLWHREC